jgi:hypothetical protein
MFDTDIIYNQTVHNTDLTTDYVELNRLLSAAIVSTGFRNLLISNPETAIANGYQGEKFNLASDEYQWLMSVQATDLTSFASQLVEYQNTHTPSSEFAIEVKIPTMSRLDYAETPEKGWSIG